MLLERDTLRRIIRTIVSTREDEIGCDDCFAELDRFAEMALAGRTPEDAMPLVSAHLERSESCREEYETLLEILRRGA